MFAAVRCAALPALRNMRSLRRYACRQDAAHEMLQRALSLTTAPLAR